MREAVSLSEQQLQLLWATLSQAEQQLAWKKRALWRKLLGRPPAQ